MIAYALFLDFKQLLISHLRTPMVRMPCSIRPM